MPVNYRDYHPSWKKISYQIRFERAQGKCEQCGAPHKEIIARSADGRYMLTSDGATYSDSTGEFLSWQKGSEFPAVRVTKVILTVAHLDHNVTNNDDSNLKAFCQRCHFMHDRKDNARRRKYGKQFVAKAATLF